VLAHHQAVTFCHLKALKQDICRASLLQSQFDLRCWKAPLLLALLLLVVVLPLLVPKQQCAFGSLGRSKASCCNSVHMAQYMLQKVHRHGPIHAPRRAPAVARVVRLASPTLQKASRRSSLRAVDPERAAAPAGKLRLLLLLLPVPHLYSSLMIRLWCVQSRTCATSSRQKGLLDSLQQCSLTSFCMQKNPAQCSCSCVSSRGKP
jgi:hypothetical protein